MDETKNGSEDLSLVGNIINEVNKKEERINEIIDVAIEKAMDKLLDNLRETYEEEMEDDERENGKSECLIMMDMMYSIFPEMKIFGPTVRDILVGVEDIEMNILLMRLSEADFNKKMDKMRKHMEIYGYMLYVNEVEEYVNGWRKFRDNYLKHGVTSGYVVKLGVKKRMKILIVSNEKMVDFNPIFICDMLMMDVNGVLSIRKNVVNELDDEKCMMNVRLKWLNRILDDINKKRIRLLTSIKVKSGYIDRMYRTKILYHTIKLMERGWQPSNYKIEDCGFNMEIERLGKGNMKKIIYPEYKIAVDGYIEERVTDKITDKINNKEGIDKINETKKGDEMNKTMDICSICMESLSSSSVIITKCGHYFHNMCIFQHMHKIGFSSMICPMCRKTIVEENEVNQNSINMRNVEVESVNVVESVVATNVNNVINISNDESDSFDDTTEEEEEEVEEIVEGYEGEEIDEYEKILMNAQI